MGVGGFRLLYQFLIAMCRKFSSIKQINDEISIQDTLGFVKVKCKKNLILNLTS